MASFNIKENLKKFDNEFQSVLNEYIHSDEIYANVQNLLTLEMNKGLSKTENTSANVKMLISYIQNLPTGSETGNYLALDLGGSNFRVLFVSLNNGNVEMKNKVYKISDTLLKSSGEKLFDYIAECISDFIKEEDLPNVYMPLGFTFSFPLKQEGLAIGRLLNWTKGFNCKGVEGEDVVKLLHEAIRRRNDIDVECVAILNDTVGCLMSCAYHDLDTRIGVIIGTGTNACYVEKLDNVKLWSGNQNYPRQVIINTEWGAFGDNNCLSFIQTEVDDLVDKQSINKGKQKFEKMISGMYMGEIIRLIVMRCHTAELMFHCGTKNIGMMSVQNAFKTEYVSSIENDDCLSDMVETRKVLSQLGIPNASNEDCVKLWFICNAVSQRAAFLTAAAISALVNKVNNINVTVGVDGSLYRYLPNFAKILLDKTQQLVNPNIKVKMILSEDGSGKGAALVAAAAYSTRHSIKASGDGRQTNELKFGRIYNNSKIQYEDEPIRQSMFMHEHIFSNFNPMANLALDVNTKMHVRTLKEEGGGECNRIVDVIYQTSNSIYGKFEPNYHTAPLSFHPCDRSFSNINYGRRLTTLNVALKETKSLPSSHC